MMNHSDPLNLDGKLKKALESFVESNVTPPKEGSLLSREQIIQNTVEELHKGLLPNEEELQKTLIRARLLLDQIGMSLLDQHSFDRLEKVFNDPLFIKNPDAPVRERLGIGQEVIPALYLLAKELYTMKKLDHAKDLLFLLLSLDSNCREALLLLGLIFQEQGELEKAIFIFSTQLGSDPCYEHFVKFLNCCLVAGLISIAQKTMEAFNVLQLTPEEEKVREQFAAIIEENMHKEEVA